MDLILHYIKISYRNILKRKGQSLIGIIGLAMSILAFTFFFYTFNYLSDFNYKIPNYKQIVRIEGRTEDKKENFVWEGNIISQLEQTNVFGIQTIGAVCASPRKGVTYFSLPDGKEIPYQTFRTRINRNITDIFSISLIHGDKDDIFKTPGNIIISESTAKKIFGDKDPIGCTIDEAGIIYTIRGIMKDMPVPNSITYFENPDYILALTSEEIYNGYFQIYSFTDNKTSLKEINDQLQNCGVRQDEFFPYLENQTIELFTEDGIHLGVLILFSTGLLVLLTGIINFLSINIGTFYNRSKELVLRKVNGATVKDIAVHFGKLYIYIYFTTILLAVPLFVLVCNFMYEQFNIVYNFKNPFFWIFLIVILLLIILSIISYRLYKISRINPAETIKTE